MKTVRICFKKALCTLLAATFLLFCCPIVPLAKGTDDDEFPSSVPNNSAATWDYSVPPEYYEIDPTDAEFEAAEDIGNVLPILVEDAITNHYDVNIYNFVAPESGYYEIYTTYTDVAEFDTIGAIYEENLLFEDYYTRIAYDDDGSSLVTQDEYDYNFRMIAELSWARNYYICVRGYGAEMDEYRLYIKPNLDTLYSLNGGIWTAQNTSSIYPTRKMHYLTKEQALLNYILSMDGVFFDLVITNADGSTFDLEYIVEKYEEDPDEAADAASTVVLGLLGMTATGGVGILTDGLDIVLDLIGIYTPEEEPQILAQNIYQACGIACTATVTPDGIMTHYSIDHGLLVETQETSSDGTEFVFSAYDDTMLYGKEYHYGTWN